MARQIPLHGPAHDFAKLTASLRDIKQHYPKSDTSFSPRDGREIRSPGHTMDAPVNTRPSKGTPCEHRALPTVVVSTVVK